MHQMCHTNELGNAKGKLVVAVLFLALPYLACLSDFEFSLLSSQQSICVLHCRASAAASLAEGRDAEVHVAGCRRECTHGL